MTKEKTARYEAIENTLRNMRTDELVSVWNEYCNAENYPDDYVYSMDEFDEQCEYMKPWEVVRAAFYGDFRPCDNYFSYNGYANFISFNYAEEENCPIDLDSLADYVDENDDALYSRELQDVLDEYPEDEDEDEDEDDEDEDEDGSRTEEA